MKPADAKPCARCGLVRPTRPDRSGYCRDCVHAVKVSGALWMAHAACRDPLYHPEWWWPVSASDPMTPNAIEICRGCQVRDLCFDFAVKHDEVHGIWGGTLPEERRRMRGLQRRKAS